MWFVCAFLAHELQYVTTKVSKHRFRDRLWIISIKENDQRFGWFALANSNGCTWGYLRLVKLTTDEAAVIDPCFVHSSTVTFPRLSMLLADSKVKMNCSFHPQKQQKHYFLCRSETPIKYLLKNAMKIVRSPLLPTYFFAAFPNFYFIPSL